MNQIKLRIEKTWDDQEIDHDAIEITLKEDANRKDTLIIQISAPFFNSPQKPNKNIGEFFNLWDYEGIKPKTVINCKNTSPKLMFLVVEVFFLADNGKYLELEFGP